MVKALNNLIGGLTGAIALNLIHQTVALLYHDAPRVDLVGEEALTKGVRRLGFAPPKGEELFAATLAGDLVSNALYYSLIGYGPDSTIVLRGAGLGITAGLGAVFFPSRMGLRDAPVTRTKQTRWLTVAWYTLGGITASWLIRSLNKK